MSNLENGWYDTQNKASWQIEEDLLVSVYVELWGPR